MAETEFAVGASSAVQKWSTSLAIEAEKLQYFRKFMGTGDDNCIKVKMELQKQAGEKITYALRMKLSGEGIEGDNIIEGTSAEEALVFHTDSLFIDQRRKGTKSKGKMTEQRVLYDLRQQGRNALATWFAEDYDEQIFLYLSGARGYMTGWHVGLSWTGRANNPLTPPNSENIVYGGNATSLATIDAADLMKVSLIEQIVAKAETQDPMIQPFRVNGERKHILLMHPYQAYDLRASTSTGDWLDIHKATDNQKSLIYQNALGEYAGVILHKHRNIVRFDSTTGMASGMYGARALFLGAQAGAIAWGGGGAMGRYSWNEEYDDRGNALAITAGAIYGVTKTRFNSKDFGVFAVDTYAVDPTA